MEDQPTPLPTDEAPPISIFDKAKELPDAEQDAPPPFTPITIDPATFGIDLTDHNPEAAAIRGENRKDGVEAPEERPHPHTELQNPGVTEDPVGDAMRRVDPFADTFDIGKISVSSAERDQFVRSALLDEEMIFDVYLEGIDVMVKIAIPTESFTVLTANILEIWDKKGAVNSKSNVAWLLAFQQMHAWYQVREFAGKETSWASFFDDGVPKISAIRKHIEDPDNLDAIVNTNSARWRMMVNAMAVAEYKYKLCLDAWRTRAFFEKADTD